MMNSAFYQDIHVLIKELTPMTTKFGKQVHLTGVDSSVANQAGAGDVDTSRTHKIEKCYNFLSVRAKINKFRQSD